jgi:integrase
VELTARFLEHQRKGRLWDAQTVLQAGKSYKLFSELCGDRPLKSYDRASAQSFKDMLQNLPADYGKAAEFRGRSLDEIGRIDAERGGKAERLSTRTVKRHFSALSGFWRWAISEKLASENPFSGFIFPSALRANEQRDMWTAEELSALFATPVWAGCLSAGRRSMPGDLVIRDEKFWLPLVAIYSGLRQEEAAQLHIEDVRKVDGHLVFDINGRPPRRLKNRNAVRKVPVHSELIRLGLLDCIKEQKDAGWVFLFPNLTPGGADQRLGHGFSKWFARYRQDVGLYRKGLDFHSFRHTATTLMQRAGVGTAAIDELTGHATPGETARYSHGHTMDQLATAIESINIKLPLKGSEASP